MATITIVVIIFLVWNFAVLYLPFDKRKKAKLGIISFGVFLLFAMYDDARDNEVPACVVYNMTNKPVEAQRHVMAMYGVEEWPTIGEDMTPLEKGVKICVIVIVIIVPTLIAIVRDKKDDEEEQNEVKSAHKIALILCSVALALLLSLYFGLKLTLLPFIKSRGQKAAEICKEGSRQPA